MYKGYKIVKCLVIFCITIKSTISTMLFKFSQISRNFVLFVLVLLGCLLGELLPLVLVLLHGLLQGRECRGEFPQSSVDWQTNSRAESHLEPGELVSELSVKHGDQRGGELGLLQVALVPELLRHHPGHPLLVVPGLGAGPQVRGRHQGRRQDLDTGRVGPVNVSGVGQLVESGEVTEVESQVGGEDGVLDHSQHLAVLAGAQVVQDPVAVQVEDDQRLVEVVSLQGGAGVELGQRGVGGQQVVVVGSCQVNIS